MEQAIKINPEAVPDLSHDIGSYILFNKIWKLRKNPDYRRKYEEWLKTPEGQRAELTREERESNDEV